MDIAKYQGVERVIAQLTAKIYADMGKHNGVPASIEDCEAAQSAIQSATIGQLLTLSNLESRWSNFAILGGPPLGTEPGTLAVMIAGCYGGMSPDGFINT